MALGGMRFVNLHGDTIKILCIHYSYNKKTWKWWESQKIHCKNWEELKLWRARNLLLEGKITVFKSLALSQITYLALVKTIPPSIIDQLKKTEEFYLEKVKP